MKENENIITLSVDDKEKEYSIILSFDSEDNHYIVYTDDEKDEEGFIKTYAGIYKEAGGKAKLLPVEDEKQLELIEKLLAKLDGEDNN